MRPLYIVGTSGLAREMALLFVALEQREWSFEGFIGADSTDIGRDLGFGRVVGDDTWLLNSERECGVVIGIGRPDVKRKIVETYRRVGGRLAYPSLIYPTAVLDERFVMLGRGNVVTAGCVFTCDIAVGDFNLFNLHTTVGHDARIGSYGVFNPSVNLSGGVTVGDGVLIGTGAQVLENRTIGSSATIGAGAVVTKDVPASITVVGVPARPLG